MKLVVAPENDNTEFILIPVGGKIQKLEEGVFTIKEGGTLVFVEKKDMKVTIAGRPLDKQEFDDAFLLALDQFNRVDEELKRKALRKVAKKSKKRSKKVSNRKKRKRKTKGKRDGRGPSSSKG